MKNIIYKFIKSVEKYPYNIAIIDKTKQYTYKALFAEIMLYRKKLYKFIKKNDNVIIYMEKSADYIVIIATIISLGGTYIPVDITCPIDRLNNIIEISKSKLIITNKIVDIKQGNCSIFNINNKYEISYNKKIKNKIKYNNNDIIYIIFTSGSTGNPKGVLITYNNLNNFIESLNKNIYKNKKERMNITVLASFSFDASIQQIFYSLCYGHTLIIPDDTIKKIGRLLLNFFHTYKIQVSDMTPSLLKLIDLDSKANIYLGLNKLLIGGEILTKDHISIVYKLFGKKLDIYNLYGPTECCIDVSYFKIDYKKFEEYNNIISIGKALDNIEIMINKYGEIVIKGLAVGVGYIGEKNVGFGIDYDGIPIFETGDIGYYDDMSNIYCAGRKDNQIKINGFRVEIEDIDQNIMKLPGISFSYTVYYNKILYSFICSKIKSEELIIKQLIDLLPKYMIPKNLIFIENIKLNKNGKIDKEYYLQQVNNI